MRHSVLLASMVLLASASSASATYMVTDFLNDRVMKFSSFDGSLIDMNFIPSNGVLQGPNEALLVGTEVWVSDQTADSIFRFSQSGTLLGTVLGPANGLDNIRGFHVQNNVVYVTNFGTANGSSGPSVRRYDATTRAFLGLHNASTYTGMTGPWDVEPHVSGDLLISDPGATSSNPLLDTAFVYRANPDGTLDSVFASGSVGGNGLGNIFSLTSLPNGDVLFGHRASSTGRLFLYNAAGTRLSEWSLTSLQLAIADAAPLGNGKILVSADGTGSFGTNGLYSLDPATGALTALWTGAMSNAAGTGGFNPRFINPIPEPAALGLLAPTALLLSRRRR